MSIRFSPIEHLRLVEAAYQKGQTVSMFVRAATDLALAPQKKSSDDKPSRRS